MAKQPLSESKKRDYWIVDSRRLIVDEDYNEREDFGDIVGLAAEIEAQGVTTPLKGYKKGENYVVIRGHRRRLALKMLEEKGLILNVPIFLEDKFKANPETWVLDLITSNDGKPLTPWEQAKVLRRLENFGWSEKDIIERSGKSGVYVRRLLSLAHAPQKLINLVRGINGKKVSATLAMEAIAEGETKVNELIEKGEKGIGIIPEGELPLYPSEPSVRPTERITKADLQKPPSWKLIQKKWFTAVDETSLPPEKVKVLQLFKRLAIGELSAEEFKEFFV